MDAIRPKISTRPVGSAADSRPDLGSHRNVPEFIYGITREIWEERGVGGKLDKYYAPDILLRAPTGLTVGNQDVVSQTLQTLHQFPDRQLVGEDVIWTLAPDDSFLSSHRLISVMTHSGDGILGAASGRVVRSRIIADCWVQKQVVREEWLVRDQASFALCLGREPRELALELTQREIRSGEPVSFFLPAHDRPGAYRPTIADDEAVHACIAGLHRIWQFKETAAIRNVYFPGAVLHAPGGKSLYGHLDIDRFVVGYLASFPDARFEVHSALVNRDAELPTRIALRWSLLGRHSGFGHFGEATGADVFVMGMSHVYLTEGQIRMEWLLADEISIWKQIHAHVASRAGV